MSGIEQTILARLRELVSRRETIRRMIAFGSRARGDAAPESDLDVIIVLDEPITPDADDYVGQCAWEAGFPHGVVVSPVVFSRKQWEEGPERHSLLALAARRDGVAA